MDLMINMSVCSVVMHICFCIRLDGDSVSGSAGVAVPAGLPNSASLPANLSSSGSIGQAWFSTSPNQNPFSQGKP